MKLTCNRESLLQSCQRVSPMIHGRDMKAVLQNIKLTASADKCTITATDLESTICLALPGTEVIEAGEVLLPAHRILAILKESTDETLTVETTKKTIHIRGQQSEFVLNSEDPKEFPEPPATSDNGHHEIAAGALKEMIHQTVFAAADDNYRYALSGTLWEIEGECVRLVATDGRRLALADGKLSSHEGQDTNGQTHVVPTKAMELLAKNLDHPDENICISLTANDVQLKTSNATIYSRMLEGRYPPYREVIPEKSKAKIELPVGSFHAAIRQAAITADKETQKVSFQFAKGKLTLQAQGADAGRSKIDLPIDYVGQPLEIAFNPKYLSDMLRVLNPEGTITISLTDENSAALLQAGDNYSYLVMPIR